MQRFVMTSIIALGLTTAANAMVVTEGVTRFDGDETNYEETLEFIGNPVYTADGEMIGYVSDATTAPDGDRMILVTFEDSFITEYAGWEFELDEKWETTGEINVEWTADQLRSWIIANGENQS